MTGQTPIAEATSTDTIPFAGGRTWFRITGDLGSALPPLVVLHGGPGAAHDYTLRIADLSAATGRPVVHYDQFGCGRSTHRPDLGADFWTVQLFLDELDTLLDALGVTTAYHLLGQSWGGMLGAEHGVRAPAGLLSLTIADSPASMELWVSEANRLRDELAPEVQSTLLAHEQAGTTDDPAYHAAVEVFYAKHVCRVQPMPPEVVASFAQIDEEPTVYHTMNGPSEFHVIGSLRTWSVIERLDSVTAPTLLVSGRYDEATPAVVQPFADRIRDVRWTVFDESSHMPHVEEPDRFLEVVAAFLAEHDPDPSAVVTSGSAALEGMSQR